MCCDTTPPRLSRSGRNASIVGGASNSTNAEASIVFEKSTSTSSRASRIWKDLSCSAGRTCPTRFLIAFDVIRKKKFPKRFLISSACLRSCSSDQSLVHRRALLASHCLVYKVRLYRRPPSTVPQHARGRSVHRLPQSLS